MRILIYAPNLKRENGGIFQYTLNLLKSIGQSDIKADFYLLFNGEDELIEALVKKNNFKILGFYDQKKREWLKYFVIFFNVLLKKVHPRLKIEIQSELDNIIKKYKIDIIHCPYQDLPKTNLVPCITTMHDVQELHFPEFFTSGQRASRAVNFKRCIDDASLVLVSFEHVRKDIIKFFSKPAEAVKILPPDVSSFWIHDFYRTSDTLNIEGITQQFFLYPAATWEHKNHLGLIRSIFELKNNRKLNFQVICTGNKTPFYYSVIEPLVRQLGLEEDIVFLGIVSDELLFSLYTNAHAVVIPTLYEAGSFPLMESIMLNTPVICSNVTSLPSTMGDSTFVFDPIDISEMATMLIKIACDEDFRAKNIAHIHKQRQKFIENRFSDTLSTIYLELYNS